MLYPDNPNIPQLERLEPPFPGVVYGKFPPGLSADELESAADVNFPEIRQLQIGNTALKPTVGAIESDAEQSYLPYPPNSFWHSDRAYYQRPTLATLLYAVEATDNAQPTDFIDMAAMLMTLEENGISRSDLAHLQGVFSGGYFYRHLLPNLANADDIQAYRTKFQVTDLNEVAKSQDAKFPPARRPLLAVNSFTGSQVAYFDELRMEAIEDPTGIVDTKEFHAQLLEYLADPEDKPYFHQHHWQPGDAILYPHFGTLHRAAPFTGKRLLGRLSFSRELSPDSL